MRFLLTLLIFLAWTTPALTPECEYPPQAPPQYAEKRVELPSRGESRTLTMEATAYTHTGNRTASGEWPRVGLVAGDPAVIPLGTRLYIEGYGEAVAADTGGDIRGMRVDVFFETEEECYRWGRRTVRVEVEQVRQLKNQRRKLN